MPYHQHTVSRRTKILFPIIITAVCGIASPRSVALVGFLMFGNLIRVCGVLDSLSETAQKTLSNLITLFLGLTIAVRMQAEYFLTKQTLLIMALGLVAFIFDTAGGVLVAKVINLFLRLDGFDTMICLAGVAIFLGITTYDSKKTKDLYYAFEGNQELLDKASIYSALELYLDFINLFLYLIRLLGRKK